MIDAEVFVEKNYWKKIVKNPESLIIKVVKKFPRKYKFINKKVNLTVVLADNKKIKLLNKKFRKKNKPTDILSFPFNEKKLLKQNVKAKKFYLGDIIISHEEFTKKNKYDYTNGFIKIFIHGFLHLLSFNHKSNKDYKIMSSIEKKLFKKVTG
tara:strand:- start:1249 stop:1707 length:459 start_codon:yes stop_codon:yes gene_type:complete